MNMMHRRPTTFRTTVHFIVLLILLIERWWFVASDLSNPRQSVSRDANTTMDGSTVPLVVANVSDSSPATNTATVSPSASETASPVADASFPPSTVPSASPTASPTASSSASPTASPTHHQLDSSTLNGKILAGYQGWFTTPDDGSGLGEWRHWSNEIRSPPGAADGANVHVAAWPDLREYDDDDELDHSTGLTNADGRPLGLFSSHRRRTVRRHVRWMREYGVDGVLVQRFVSEIGPTSSVKERRFRDAVLSHVRDGCEEHGRVFAVMWDLSGKDVETDVIADAIAKDWRYLVDETSLVESPSYLHHDGRPVVAVWGFGFKGRAGTPSELTRVTDFFRDAPDPRHRAVVIGGVPVVWRNETEEDWAEAYRSFDFLSPWTVGRYRDLEGVERHRREHWEKDLRECERIGIGYLPVVFPGYSFHNANRENKTFNEIPRLGGRFYWHQLHHAAAAGATAAYVAMFDELDEGTAVFKVAETNDRTPATGRFVTLNEDDAPLPRSGTNNAAAACVPSDWYLTLTGTATRWFRTGDGKIPLEMPDYPVEGCSAEEEKERGGDRGPIVRYVTIAFLVVVGGMISYVLYIVRKS